MAKTRNKFVPLPLFLIFVSAVLVPSIALSFLALRAADRESVYVERRLEGTLLVEADLTAQRIEELMDEVSAGLRENASTLPADRAALPAWLSKWKDGNALVEVPFALQNGRLFLPPLSPPAEASFKNDFATFLQNGARLPIYDSIARVYRKEMQEQTAPSSFRVGASEPVLHDAKIEQEKVSAPEAEDRAPSIAAMPESSAAKKVRMPSGGSAQKQAESKIATNPAVREDAFRQAESEGFSILQRNVMPQGQRVPADHTQDERSRTVSRGRTFGELLNESPSGLLPRLSERGLEILFWTRQAEGRIVGCTLRMDTLRERIVNCLPALLSEVRILTVLDDAGEPLVVPDLSGVPASPEWRRPFVAREISPLLPRWEAAAWLTDPAFLTSRARFATLAVWVMVAILFLLIALGSAVVLRMLSSEIHLAGQKTTFVANVSHELKTPLTSIRLFAELLLSGKQPDEERRREYLRTMMSEAERLSRLVDNVLAFSKRGRNGPTTQPLLLDTLARETLEQLEPHLAKNGFRIDMRCECERHPTVRGNREELRQVIMNLLSNAEKYSEEYREISVRCRQEDDFAVVEVADRGIGIEPRFADKIFQEFFRIDDSLSTPRSGAGLGLAIARDIARRHGGDLLYFPRSGGGSVFTLRLRAEDPDPVTASR